MRITPAKWDAEYAWLRGDGGVSAWQTAPKVKVRKEARSKSTVGMGRPSAVGLALQALGAVLLGILALDGNLLTLLPLVALVGGEVIFISSWGHRGERSAGDR